MNIAMRSGPGTYRAKATPHSRIANVEIFENLAEAEPYWRALEQSNNLSTPYQRYDFLRLWQHHVGAAAGVTPFIVAGFNVDGIPQFLWPFGRRTLGGMKVVEFLGGKHANFNMGLWRPDVAAGIEADDLRAVLARFDGCADMLRLVNQPLTWGGTTNPFALLPHQRSANFGFSGTLIADYDALLRARTNSATRKKMRKKERALARFGDVRIELPRGAQEIRRVLDVFFKQKSTRMRALGVRDAFAPPGVRRFIEAAAIEQLPGGKPLIELYALSVGDIIVATFAGMVGGGRFCGMFNSIIKGRYAAESPGEQLMALVVRQACKRELDTFDLGIGQANYKALFCNDTELLFDSYLPVGKRGRLLAAIVAKLAALKREVKAHPAVWSIVREGRRLRARLSNAI